jgi:hypothetical protein
VYGQHDKDMPVCHAWTFALTPQGVGMHRGQSHFLPCPAGESDNYHLLRSSSRRTAMSVIAHCLEKALCAKPRLRYARTQVEGYMVNDDT